MQAYDFILCLECVKLYQMIVLPVFKFCVLVYEKSGFELRYLLFAVLLT